MEKVQATSKIKAGSVIRLEITPEFPPLAAILATCPSRRNAADDQFMVFRAQILSVHMQVAIRSLE
jgi:hypothetical protein